MMIFNLKLNRILIAFTWMFVAGFPMLLNADQTVFFEDFEDATVGFTTFPESLTNIAAVDYYGRIDAASGLPSYGDYGNKQGAGFYGLENQDSAGVPLTTVTMSVFGINIETLTALQVSLFVAEDDATDGNQDWDIASSVRLEAQIDGNGFANIFAIEGASDTVGNQMARRDTNFDGIGDGVEITQDFTQFNLMLSDFAGTLGASTGTFLDLRFTITGLDQNDEDIAIDNVHVFGVPEPSALGFLMLFGTVAGLRRRR